MTTCLAKMTIPMFSRNLTQCDKHCVSQELGVSFEQSTVIWLIKCSQRNISVFTALLIKCRPPNAKVIWLQQALCVRRITNHSAVNCDLINQVKPSKHFWWHYTPIGMVPAMSNKDLIECNNPCDEEWDWTTSFFSDKYLSKAASKNYSKPFLTF